jgi:3-methylcrotonyl-CoA carboxylase alpha subunit
MSGTMVKIFAKVGDKVTKGQPLFVLEAMKMEHTIRASIDSTVKSVSSKEGAFVEAGATIV